MYLHEEQIKEFHSEQELSGTLGVAFAYSWMLPESPCKQRIPIKCRLLLESHHYFPFCLLWRSWSFPPTANWSQVIKSALELSEKLSVLVGNFHVWWSEMLRKQPLISGQTMPKNLANGPPSVQRIDGNNWTCRLAPELLVWLLGVNANLFFSSFSPGAPILWFN